MVYYYYAITFKKKKINFKPLVIYKHIYTILLYTEDLQRHYNL